MPHSIHFSSLLAPVESYLDFRVLFARSPDAQLLIGGESGLIMAANPAVTRLLGYGPEVLLGAPADLLLPEHADSFAYPEERAHDAVLRMPIRRGDGTVHDFEVTLFSFVSAGPPMLLVTFRDIRERSRISLREQGRQESRAQESRLRSVGTLAAGIAHDFNNILTHIFCNADLAREEVTPHPEAEECLEQIEAASERAADLCRQMLAYAGESNFTLETVDLGALVRSITPELSDFLPLGHPFQFHVAPEPLLIRADSSQIRQVIANLVLNAAEAVNGLPASEIAVSVARAMAPSEVDAHTTILGEPVGESGIRLEVRDAGCGMSDEIRKRIFEPFFSTKFRGRGLGLAAVWGVARRHHAQVRVTSQPGVGTRFQIWFPPADSASPPPTVLSRRDTVLLLASNPERRHSTSRLLQSLGFNSLPVSTFAAAVEHWGSERARLGLVMIDLAELNADPAALRDWLALHLDVPLLCLQEVPGSSPALVALLRPAAVLGAPLTLPILESTLRQYAPALFDRHSSASL